MNKFLLLVGLGLGLLSSELARGATIFESGTLGVTGVTWEELYNQTVPGTNVSGSVFAGVRFQLDQPAVISQVGGHFAAPTSGTFFGAIVRLDGEDDFPDSGDFSTPDFLGSTLLTFPTASDEVFGELILPLDSGWYALVFGSGLFDAAGGGVAVRNNIDIGNPTYFVGSPNTPGIWSDITAISPNHRFVVNGNFVPEPSAMALAVSVSFLLIASKRSMRKDHM